jgi:tetratricopeptide (TPR) repeat protein
MSPGIGHVRTNTLDRRETDFKRSELVVRGERNPEISPKSLELLRQGEDLYSRGLYHQAIHVWTRILFLDRGNPEARLRIDDAKNAVAELQRRLDAQIAEAKELFDAGEIEAARERVRSVLAADGSHGEAIQLAEAIEALDRKSEPPQEASRQADSLAPKTSSPAQGVVIRVPKGPRPSHRVAPSGASRSKMAAFLCGALLLFVVSAFYLSENWEAIVSDGATGHRADLATAVLSERLAASVPDLSQLHYYNGERLFAQGRYRDALAELRRVDRGSTVMVGARSLIVRIEDRLLRGPTGPEPAIDAAR